jgi:hypothetical protein
MRGNTKLRCSSPQMDFRGKELRFSGEFESFAFPLLNQQGSEVSALVAIWHGSSPLSSSTKPLARRRFAVLGRPKLWRD